MLSDVTWLEDGLGNAFPQISSHDEADTAQTMNTCLVDPEEAAPWLGQGKPAQEQATGGGVRGRSNQTSSRRISDRSLMNELSASRGY